MVKEQTEPGEFEMGMRRFLVQTPAGVWVQVQVTQLRDAGVPDIHPVADLSLVSTVPDNTALAHACIKLANELVKSPGKSL